MKVHLPSFLCGLIAVIWNIKQLCRGGGRAALNLLYSPHLYQSSAHPPNKHLWTSELCCTPSHRFSCLLNRLLSILQHQHGVPLREDTWFFGQEAKPRPITCLLYSLNRLSWFVLKVLKNKWRRRGINIPEAQSVQTRGPSAPG